MREKINELYNNLCDLLDNAPDEDQCTDEENEMYADMANLKDSIELAGYNED